MINNAEYIRFSDVKWDTSGGASSAKTWHIRTLNTIDISSNNIGCLENDCTIVLQPGLYRCNIVCPTYSTTNSQIALYNLTDMRVELFGQYQTVKVTSTYQQAQIQLIGLVYCSKQTKFLVVQYTERAQANNGLGIPTGSKTYYYCVYTVAEFWKMQ